MSQRHRLASIEAGVLTPLTKEERRRERRRERHEARAALIAADDPDGIVLPEVPHTAVRATEARTTDPRRQLRHWKQPFWKRRTASRHAKNVALASIARQP